MAQDNSNISRLAAEMAPKPEWLKGLSAMGWGMSGGMLGLEHPDEDVREWQAEHPWLTLGSEMVGLGGFFGAGMKAAKATGYASKVKNLVSAEKAASMPFRAKALQEMALIAPIEATRQATGATIQALGDYEGPSLGERAIETGANTVLGGAIAGTFAKIASAGKRVLLPKALQDISQSGSWQNSLRTARQALENELDPEVRNRIENMIIDFQNKIRTESRENLIGPLEGEIPEGRLKSLNTLLKGTPGITSRQFSIQPNLGFKKLSELDNIISSLKENGTLPEDWLEYSQFPRVVRNSKPGAKTHLDSVIQETMEPVGDGWFIRKEKDGLYVLARKTADGEGVSEYFVTKTDFPGKFIPEKGDLLQVTSKTAWQDPDKVFLPTGTSDNILDQTLSYSSAIEDGIKKSDVKGTKFWEASRDGAKAFAEHLGIKNLGENELLGRILEQSKRAFSPTMFEFKNAPRARKIFAVTRNLYDSAERKAAEWIYGIPEAGKTASGRTRNLFEVVSAGVRRANENSLSAKLAEVEKNPTAWRAFLEILDKYKRSEVMGNTTDEALLALKQAIGKDGLEALTMLDKLSGPTGPYLEMADTFSALHKDPRRLYPLRDDYWGFSHFWKGSLRQEVLDSQGRRMYIFSGDNKKAIVKNAERLVAEARKRGDNWKLGDYWEHNSEIDIEKITGLSEDGLATSRRLMNEVAQSHPGIIEASFFKPRAGIEGYSKPTTATELTDALYKSVRAKYRWLAKTIEENVLEHDLATLAIDSPETYQALIEKTSLIRGEQGPISKLINKLSDRILSPVLGTDSADKIVSAINKFHAAVDLGFMNAGYALANILQPITTVLPQLALLRSCPEALQWAYDCAPLISKSGKGTIANIPSPIKMMSAGLKLMAKPESEVGFKEFTDWMIREGALSPKFVDEVIGKHSVFGGAILESAKKGNISETITELGSLIPRFSEQLSRGFTLGVGYKIASSLGKVNSWSKEQIYLFAKQFVDNTMFLYSASDRSMLLQGPVGKAWGLFKNWTMHYVGWQLEYLDAGLKHGVWGPWLYSNVATSLLGGLGASELGKSLELCAEWLGDDRMTNLVYDRWGDSAESNFILYGLPGLAGFSLQGQVNSPFTDPGEEIQRFMGFVYGNRLKATWNALDKAVDVWATTGDNPILNSDVQKQLSRAFAPKMFYRGMQMIGDSLYSMNGNLVMDNISKGDQIAYKFFNLPSTRIQQGLEISSQIWKDKDKRRALTSKYSTVMAEALDAGDGRMMWRIIERALVDGIDVPSMMHSAQTRMKNNYLTPLMRNKDYYGVWGPTANALGL